jgi:hypothetical protein
MQERASAMLARLSDDVSFRVRREATVKA